MAPFQSQVLGVPTETTQSIRVFILDNHQLFAHSLKEFLDDLPDIQVVGTAAGTALAVAAAARPQVVVVAPDPDDGTLGKAVGEVRSALPEAGIIVLTLHQAEARRLIEFEADASAFLDQYAASDDLVGAIRAVAVPPPIRSLTGQR